MVGCDKQTFPSLPSPPLPSVCTYTCHEACYKKVNKKCRSKHCDQLKPVDEEEAMRVSVCGVMTQYIDTYIHSEGEWWMGRNDSVYMHLRTSIHYDHSL